MITYFWRGISGQGDTVSGVIRSSDISSARQELSQRVWCLIEVRPTFWSSFTVLIGQVIGLFTLSDTDLSFFCRQLQGLLSGGLSVFQAIKVLALHAHGVVFHVALKSIEGELLEGKSFSQAIRRQKQFPLFMTELVAAAELSAALPSLLGYASRFLEKRARYVEQLRRLLLLPLVTGVVGYVIVSVLVHIVLPIFESVLQQTNVGLPGSTALTFLYIRWFTSWGLESLFIFFVILSLLYGIASSVFIFRVQRDWLLYKTPLLGGLYYAADMITFFSSLQVLIAANIPLSRAIFLSGQITNNLYFIFICKNLQRSLRSGVALTLALKMSDFFPKEWVSLLSIAKQQKDISSACGEVALLLTNDLEGVMHRIFVIVPIVLLLIIGGGVGAIILLLYKPILLLMQNM